MRVESAACPIQAMRVGEAADATPFHAELDPDRLVDGMTLDRDHGGFRSEPLAIGARMRAAVSRRGRSASSPGFLAGFAR